MHQARDQIPTGEKFLQISPWICPSTLTSITDITLSHRQELPMIVRLTLTYSRVSAVKWHQMKCHVKFRTDSLDQECLHLPF